MWLFLTGSGEITNADLQSLADGSSDAYAGNLMPLVNPQSTLLATQVILWFDGDVFDAFSPSVVDGTFTVASDWPASTSACISWKIPSHYRGGHPRTYLCGLGNEHGAPDGQSLSSAFQSAATAAAQSFHDELEGLGPIGGGITTVEHGIVSFVDNNAWRTPPIFRRITQAVVDSRVDSQRRRLGPDRPF